MKSSLILIAVAASLSFARPSVLGDDKAPEIVKLVKPTFSEAMQKLALRGTVWVKVHVDVDGLVNEAIVTKSDVSQFNDVTVEAALKCKFSPAIRNGQPAATWVLIPFVFRAGNETAAK